MINKELCLNISGVEVSVFMQDNFFAHKSHASPIHRHTYPELHVCIKGSSLFFAGSDEVRINEGEMLVIPGGMYHRTETEPGVERASFQISLPLNTLKKHTLPAGISHELYNEIESYNSTQKHLKLSAVLTMIISNVIEKCENPIHDITDRSFLIHEFLLYNYNKQISLFDLAKELNLSEKQAARSVKACFGTTFSEELIKRRMEAAKHLRETTDISLQDIASMVGYLSYSGFWKAYNAYKKDRQ
ncbi:MAG: helix-turn-helix domain-containing protein [Clostridia bacterium]|nr:helix-turn-helix domain-containing protein [Clostridia bacterium]